MSNPWFRMYSEFANDPIVQSLAFEDQRHYIIILCLKCQGVLDRKLLPASRERIILRGLGLDEASAREVKRRLIEVEFITEDWQPVAWDKRQFKSDNSAERSRKSRINKGSNTVAATNRYVSVSVYELLNNYINVSTEIWLEFEQHRKEIKKPLTELSTKKNLEILNKLSPEEQREAVNTTISNRWTGIFPPKLTQKKTSGKMGRAKDVIEKKYA